MPITIPDCAPLYYPPRITCMPMDK